MNKKKQHVNPASQQAKPSLLHRLPTWLLPVTYSIAFAALAWYFLYASNADTMFFLQDRGW